MFGLAKLASMPIEKKAGLDQISRLMRAEAKAVVKRNVEGDTPGISEHWHDFANEISAGKKQINNEFKTSGMTSEEFRKHIRPKLSNVIGDEGEHWYDELPEQFPARNFLK